MKDNQETKVKMNFIKENLLPELESKFYEFLDLQKKGGSKLDSWSVDEIKKLILEFNGSIPKRFSSSFGPITKNKNNLVPSIFYKETPKIIYSKNIDQNGLQGNIANIQVLEVKIVNEGIFYGKHAEYIIKTQPQGWKVKRTLIHFDWLKNQLNNSINNIDDNKKIENGRKQLQIFLDEINLNQVLRTTEEFYVFLSCKDEMEFNMRKKALITSKPVDTIEETKNINECAIIEFNEDIVELCENIEEGIENILDLFKEIHEVYKSISIECAKISQLYSVSGKLYEKLQEEFSKLKHKNMEKFTKSLNLSHFTLTDFFYQQKNEIEEKIIDHFPRYIFEIQNFSQYITKWRNQHTSYRHSLKSLKRKKTNLFLNQNYSKWEIRKECPIPPIDLANNKDFAFKYLLPQETDDTYQKKIIYGYLCNVSINEFNRLWDKNSDLLLSSFLVYTQRLKTVTENVNLMWTDLMAKLTGNINEKLNYIIEI